MPEYLGTPSVGNGNLGYLDATFHRSDPATRRDCFDNLEIWLVGLEDIKLDCRAVPDALADAVTTFK
jgi:hypothetical protein